MRQSFVEQSGQGPGTRWSRRRTIAGGFAVALLFSVIGVTGPASAQTFSAAEVISFATGDPATDPGTEGIAIDGEGNLYVSANTAAGGQIWKIAPGADEPEVLATLIPPTAGAGFGVLGMDIHHHHLVVAVHTLADPELNGVWTVDMTSGAASHLPGSEAIALPNDVTVWDGAFYVTDSAGGAIWRVSHDGAEVWLQHELLEGLGVAIPGLPIGANGIDVYKGRFYVANLEKSLVASIYINRRGEAVAPRLFNTVDGFPDGLEVDRRGRPHVVLINANALVRVGKRTNVTLIDDSEILDAPSSLTFGPRRRRQTVYVVNFSIAEGFPGIFEQSEVGPSIVAVN